MANSSLSKTFMARVVLYSALAGVLYASSDDILDADWSRVFERDAADVIMEGIQKSRWREQHGLNPPPEPCPYCFTLDRV